MGSSYVPWPLTTAHHTCFSIKEIEISGHFVWRKEGWPHVTYLTDMAAPQRLTPAQHHQGLASGQYSMIKLGQACQPSWGTPRHSTPPPLEAAPRQGRGAVAAGAGLLPLDPVDWPFIVPTSLRSRSTNETHCSLTLSLRSHDPAQAAFTTAETWRSSRISFGCRCKTTGTGGAVETQLWTMILPTRHTDGQTIWIGVQRLQARNLGGSTRAARLKQTGSLMTAWCRAWQCIIEALSNRRAAVP